MKRTLPTALSTTLLAVAAALALAGATVGPAAAEGAQRGVYVEDYDASEHFDAGDGLCVPWPGTFREARSGAYRLVAAPGGRDQGEFHVNGAIDGLIQLTPDDPTLPTFTGVYREKANGVLTVSPEGDDIERVSQFRLRSTLRGTDGSTLELRLSGKVTMNANGDLSVSRGTFTCE